MSFGHYYLGYLMGQQQAQSSQAFEQSLRQAVQQHGDGVIGGLPYLLPMIEMVLVGVASYLYLSGATGLQGRGLHLDAFYGVVGAVVLACLWIGLFGLPVLGSLANVLVSCVWAAVAWGLSQSGVWLLALFLLSMGMHYLVFLLGGPAGAPTPAQRLREKITLALGTLLVLGAFVGLGLAAASQRGVALPWPPARELAQVVAALGVAVLGYKVNAAHGRTGERAKNWWPALAILALLVAGYYLANWAGNRVVSPLMQAWSLPRGAQAQPGPVTGPAATCRAVPNYPYVARVTVQQDGQLLLNGQPVALQALDKRLAQLGPNSALWLHQAGRAQGRQNAAAVGEVIRLQMKHKMHFTNSDRPDFLDVACSPYWRTLRP